jgi:four helix bundle protein
VWHRAHAFNREVQRVLRTFPRGYAELKSQLLRAADSIPSNIVEGCGAATRRELARYVDISIKSAFEVDYRLQFARDDGVLPYAKWRSLTEELTQIRKMLYAFRMTVLEADRADEERKARSRRQRRRGASRPDDNRSKTDD